MTPTTMSTASNITRRGILAGLAVGAVALALPRGAFALTNQEASNLVAQAVAEINRVIASGKPEAAMYKDFSTLLGRYADVNVMGRSALGPAARQASAAQLAAFTRAFQDYLGRKYGRQFREFIGGSVEVVNTKQLKSFYEVQATAKLRGKEPMDVRFQVSDRSGANKFFNIIVEGVNLLATERTEIGAMLDRRRGDIDGLIADLKTAG